MIVAGNFGKSNVAAAPTVLANKLKFTSQQKWSIQSAIVELEGILARSQAEELVLNLLVAMLPERLPEQTQLLPNYPNPFNPETWIPFVLDEAAEVEISIYKVTSNQVRRLRLGRQNAGEYHTREKAAYWDGRNDAGETMGSGICLYEMRIGDYTSVRKAMLLK